MIDTAAALSITNANVAKSRSKRVDTKAHFVREQVHKGAIRTLYGPTDKQHADITTKPLPLRHANESSIK